MHHFKTGISDLIWAIIMAIPLKMNRAEIDKQYSLQCGEKASPPVKSDL